ncbi:MAG: tRNA (Uracil-5-)-methyltransferase, partial [Actinomycetota bacterium]
AAARDLFELTGLGYRLVDLTAMDLFPQTHHFETILSLQLANL